MAKTIKITLAGQDYEVPRINVGQAEDLAEFWSNLDAKGAPLGEDGQPLSGKAAVRLMLNVAAVVLRRAVPQIPDVRDLDCELDEIQEASTKVLVFSKLSRGGGEASEGNGAAGERPAA